MRRRSFLASGVCAWVGAPLLAAETSRWPTKPVRLVVPFPAGSSPDFVARLLAEPLARVFGQPWVIDNRPGAGGNIGTGAVAHAEPDGHTLLFTIQGPLVTAPQLVMHLGYDPFKDLAPVSLVATSPNVLVVDPSLGASTLKEFLQVAAAKPGRLNYGSVGNGSAAHLAMELLKARAGVDLVHVPYAGFAQVVNAILAGEVQAGIMVPSLAMGQVRAGRLKALGVTTPGRVVSLPELPSLAEQGLAPFEAVSWQAVLAPARTPPSVIDRLSQALVRILRDDEVRSKLLAQYFSAAGTAPEALASLMAAERERWAQVIRQAHVRRE